MVHEDQSLFLFLIPYKQPVDQEVSSSADHEEHSQNQDQKIPRQDSYNSLHKTQNQCGQHTAEDVLPLVNGVPQ